MQLTVLFRKDLSIFHRLNGRVVMILMDFFVDCRLYFLVLAWELGVVNDGWSNLLMHSSVVVTRLVHEVGNGCLGFLHCDLSV